MEINYFKTVNKTVNKIKKKNIYTYLTLYFIA